MEALRNEGWKKRVRQSQRRLSRQKMELISKCGWAIKRGLDQTNLLMEIFAC